MVRVLVGVRGCVPRPTRHSLVTLFFLSLSVKDRPLHWVLDKSQTYYPKHILIYGSREGGDGGGLSIALSPGLMWGGLESKFRWGPGPLDRRVVGWSCLCLGKSGACVSGYPAGIHWFTNRRVIRYNLAMV